MSVHTFSSRDFTRDVSAAKRAAVDGPVFITDRGRPAFALLKIEDYYRITGHGETALLAGHGETTLLDVMDNIPSGGEIQFEPARLDIHIRDVEFE